MLNRDLKTVQICLKEEYYELHFGVRQGQFYGRIHESIPFWQAILLL